jgi:hypothetical protein
VGCDQKGQVTQHLDSNKHSEAVKRREACEAEQKERQEMLTNTVCRMRTNAIEATSFNSDTASSMHVESQIGQDVAAKAKQIRDKNDGIAQLTAIAGVIFDCETGTDPVLKKYSASELACFKYCPIASCDVERSFSMLKALYRDNRSSFSDDNLSKHMVIHYNATPQTLPW